MAEVTQYQFDHKEAVIALIKAQGIHEGIWALLVEFSFGAGTAGPSEEEAMPTAMVSIKKLGLARVSTLTISAVDAAEVNPRLKKVKRG